MNKALFNIILWVYLSVLIWIDIIVLAFGGITLAGILMIVYTLLLFVVMYYYLFKSNITFTLYWLYLSIAVCLSTVFIEDASAIALVFLIPIGYQIFYILKLKQ